MAGSRPGKKKTEKNKTQGRAEASKASASARSSGVKKKKKKQEPRTAFQHLQHLSKWVDLIIEVIDARAPLSTRHPNSNSIFGNRPRIFVLTKEDLAHLDRAKKVMGELSREAGIESILVSLKRTAGRERVINMALEATREKQESIKRKGLLERPMRICVVGLPNVGKSSLINWLIGQKKTKTGNRPGITQGTQWVRVHPKLELLDTPGILPVHNFDEQIRLKLASLNLLPQANYQDEQVAENILAMLKQSYPQLLDKFVPGLSDAEDGLTLIAEKRNLIGQKATPDRLRAAALLIKDLRSGNLGRITLD